MTGHGQAIVQDDRVLVLAEIRSVNNRFLKVLITGELDPVHQARLESLVRETATRGLINLRVQIQFLTGKQDYQINTALIKSYRDQLSQLEYGGRQLSLESLLGLPGIVIEAFGDEHVESAWGSIESATRQALQRMLEMRRHEGEAMQADLLNNCESVARLVEQIRHLAPTVVENYSRRLSDRINHLLEDYKLTLAPSDLIREVGLFADRVDISEELVRLDSHLQQFEAVVTGDASNGRKLDFLTQELLRETNTIGSKANSSEIANRVVEMKTVIERIREMVQNVE
jgi:uncharacterized protein (TIGR00255 family)